MQISYPFQLEWHVTLDNVTLVAASSSAHPSVCLNIISDPGKRVKSDVI